ncbi:MAG: S1C family serine protease [Beijerinckiaceae bacterium]
MAGPDWRIPSSQQPVREDYGYDLDEVLDSMVAISSRVPEDAFTAETLGTERAGNGVLISDRGVVLTIGYLISEAEEVWIRANDGRLFPAHVLAYDQETGFGLVQALARLDLPVAKIGESEEAEVGDAVLIAGAGGRQRSVAGHIVARQEFAGYWEYILDDALFTAPAHPNWGGTGVFNEAGELIGIGSLHLEQGTEDDTRDHINMIVPIGLLKPILDDLMKFGRRRGAPKPWLGLYATELEDRVVVVGRSQRGPARRANLRNGDIVAAVGGQQVSTLASLYRLIQRQGDAGAIVPLTILRDGKTMEVEIKSDDRTRMFRAPKLH